MARTRNHRRQRRSASVAKPFQLLRNPFPPTEVLNKEDVISIHDASMRVLEETGLEIWDAESRSILKAAGAKVDETAQRVWLDREMVLEAVAKAPSQFTLHSRNPAKTLTLGGNHIVFGAVGGPPFITDMDRGRRAGTLADLQNLNRLIHMCDALTLGGGHLIEPTDMPVSSAHLDSVYADITLTDKAPRATALGGGVAQDVVTMMAIAHADSSTTTEEALAAIRHKAVVMAVISVNSPLRFDRLMLQGLLALARNGQVPIISPTLMAGAMSPASMPSAVMQQNAEVLAGVTLTQLVNPGGPVVYGGFIAPLDLKSGATAFGGPDAAWALFAAAQMARHYQLPLRSAAGLTNSQVADGQAAYESLFGLWPAVMAHTNCILHAAGWLDGGLSASFEKFILDVEMVQMLYSFFKERPINAESLALEYIYQVGPGGHHLETAHTMANYRTAFYQPMLSSRLPYETWLEEGQLDTAQRANHKWKELLKNYEQPPLDPGVDEALQAYMNRRKRELDNGL